MGFVGNKNAYLRDPWNILDFIIVITGYHILLNPFSTVDLLIILISPSTTKFSLKALRNLRVLRPLKTINQIPSMKRLVSTLLRSLPDLVNVTIFLFFIFTLFGILGS